MRHTLRIVTPCFSSGFHHFFESGTGPVVKMTSPMHCIKEPSNPKKLILGQFGQESPIGMAFGGRGVGLPGASPWTCTPYGLRRSELGDDLLLEPLCLGEYQP
jgi:hypothetical protein